MDDFLSQINFPYSSLRKGQLEFLRKVNESILARKSIIVSAPTGLGKTISALAPAIAIAKEKNLSVVFLTSRQTQANQAIKTIADISKKAKSPINFVAFVGKRNMCSHPDRDLYPSSDFNEFCRKMKESGKCSFYKNFKNSDFEEKQKVILEQSSVVFMGVEDFVSLCSSNKFCAYEMAAKKAQRTDVVICDYNYLFSSSIVESFLGRLSRPIEECVLVVDEAHNLPDRIRNAYSYSISTEGLKNALKELSEFVKSSKYDKFVTDFKAVLEEYYFDFMLGEKSEYLVDKNAILDKYVAKLGSLLTFDMIVESLVDVAVLVREERVISFVGRFVNFLQKLKSSVPEESIVVLEKEVLKDKTIISCKVKCIDPSNIAGEIINSAFGSVLMSATLSPVLMYKDILGLENCEFLELESPFPPENQLILVDDTITSKYSVRDKDMYKKIAERVQSFLFAGSSRNAIVFFPSYEFMERVTSCINYLTLDRRVFVEQKYMTKEQKESFIAKFKENTGISGKAKVLFGIVSGSFAEGLDLPKEALEMVLVVGLPLSVPDVTSDCLVRHYEKKFRKGQLYGYIFPAMNRIIQAGGRCIRTEEDKGVIILMDYRYLYPVYAQVFPKHWHLRVVEDIGGVVSDFFTKL